MPWLKWLPWRFVLSRAARSQGFLDPVALLGRLHRFAQPSEVGEPIELLRAGAVFHARGLINSRVIQHNLDWVWPYWVERQFDPLDVSFVPRAFSITHINLTHRNWTAVGWPDCEALPIVDPRGLFTPHFDSWSLDGWILAEDGRCLLPSRAPSTFQTLELSPWPTLVTETRQAGLRLVSRAWVALEAGHPVSHLRLEADADAPAWLILALRPYNPEGISFIHEVTLSPQRTQWTVDGRRQVVLGAPAERHHVSDYHAGDVHIHLADLEDQLGVRCEVGMATAAALYRIEPGQGRELTVTLPLEATGRSEIRDYPSWPQALDGHCTVQVSEPRYQFLYDAAIKTLVLHAPEDVYPGPYTYKRFWFRDAAFILHGLLCAGLFSHAERALDRFPARQTPRGYFLSQAGEWDSNGEALWIMDRFCRYTGHPPKPRWHRAVRRGARWIARKRLPHTPPSPHAGLLPAGFSAEHLGPNDYYYWDDFWGIAGLRSAARLATGFDAAAAREFEHEAEDFQGAIERSLTAVVQRLGREAIPASPYRRLDAGAIGSLAVSYPLQLCPPDDPRVLGTAEYLLSECFVQGGFFQDMIHSGINAYLTLHVAQVLLRAGDPRHLRLMDRVAELASPTGQWPEAIHPRTLGGCMGDGQHVWAAAEWILMVRNCLVREEGEHLILCSGVPQRWLDGGQPVTFGPAPTPFGTISIELRALGGPGPRRVTLSWEARWHTRPPRLEVRLPGYPAVAAAEGDHRLELTEEPAP